MKALAVILGVLALAAPASASRPAGISGYVIDLDNGRALARAEVQIYRMPVENTAAPVAMLLTNVRGFFSDITLVPGRYMVVATAKGVRSGCEISNLYEGVVARFTMKISSHGERCIGRNVHSALVVPGQTADVYDVH